MIKLTGLGFILGGLIVNGWAQDEEISSEEPSANSTLAENIYEAAKPIELAPAAYPRKMAQEAREGWVDFSFMVDAAGKPYEIEAINHSYGGEEFIESATEAIELYQYEPARLNGEPVDSSTEIRLRFQMEDGDAIAAASRAFIRRYNRFREALAAQDREEAEKSLTQLRESKGLSLYDDAYLNLASYLYEEKYGSSDKQIKYLYNIFHAGAKKYFENEIQVSLLTKVLLLELEKMRFHEARNTFNRLAKLEGTYELITKLEKTIDNVVLLKNDDRAYEVNGQIDEKGYWSIGLYKSAIRFNDIVGEIDEFKLKCSSKFLFVKYEQNMVYEIPEDYGHCFISVYGTEGTSFKLMQMAATKN